MVYPIIWTTYKFFRHNLLGQKIKSKVMHQVITLDFHPKKFNNTTPLLDHFTFDLQYHWRIAG